MLSIALWFLMSSAAPLPEFSGDLGFQQFVQNSQEFSGQMMNDAATMKALIVSCGQRRENTGVREVAGEGGGADGHAL